MPSLAFADVELQRCEPELNLLGLPKPVSGSFASVYQMRGEKGTRWAVRCFLRNVPNQEERYAAISDQLARNKLPCMVPFEFVPQGIRVNERWFPILKMQWVDGIPLIEWIERNLEDAAKLTALQSRLKETIESLASVGIAHGDLQHGNIFVSRDGRTVKLVDYDGLYVPALEAMGSAEIGHRHYQHPARNGSHFGGYLDNFSAWSIWLSLRIIAQDHRIWRKLGAGDECLIFRQEDYADPRESVAFSFLEHHDSAMVREASETMRRLLALRPQDVPPLGEPLPGSGKLDCLPPLAVPGAALNAPADHVKNVRVLVAEAKAPTLVVDPPRVRLKTVEEKPSRQAPTHSIPVLLSNQPPTTPQSAPAATPAQTHIWTVVTGLVFGFVFLANHFLNSNPTPQPMSAFARRSIAARPDVRVITDLSHQTGNSTVDEQINRYLGAKMVALSNAAAKDPKKLEDALSEMQYAEGKIRPENYWIAEQALEIAKLQLRLKQPLQAAGTLSDDLAYCQNPNWRYNKAALLRQSALEAMNINEPGALHSYGDSVLLATTDPVVHAALFPKGSGDEGIYVFNDITTEARHLESKGNYDLAIQLCLNGTRMFANNKVLSVDAKAPVYMAKLMTMITQLETQRARHEKRY